MLVDDPPASSPYSQERLNMAAMRYDDRQVQISVDPAGDDRREHRRHDMETQGIAVDRWDGSRRVGKPFGQIVDLSAGGVRIRTEQPNIKADNQIRVRLELPPFAGICPFVDTS